jgi:hypothetical protein
MFVLKIQVFWDVMPFSLLNGNQCFERLFFVLAHIYVDGQYLNDGA